MFIGQRAAWRVDSLHRGPRSGRLCLGRSAWEFSCGPARPAATPKPRDDQRQHVARRDAAPFEPGQKREVRLVAYGGERNVYGFNAGIMGPLGDAK